MSLIGTKKHEVTKSERRAARRERELVKLEALQANINPARPNRAERRAKERMGPKQQQAISNGYIELNRLNPTMPVQRMTQIIERNTRIILMAKGGRVVKR